MSEKMADKVKKRIADLEQAIQSLDFVKRHLNQNSSEIKSQIHTSISRHLETLRNREVWLLAQVDQVLVGKEEVLQRQQARLNKALGILHSSLAHATDCSEDDETAARHLAQALDELKTAELKAEETPYIAFRADQVALRESILSYGRVDANGMPLQSAFADEDYPSASLPRHVEEYEDSNHHIFYKALQEGKANSATIHVTMPKLSSRVEDWLQRPMLQLNTTSSSALDGGKVKSPASEPTPVSTPLSQTTCAIQNWLSEIKHNPDLEDDDDFEIVDHSGSSQRESPIDGKQQQQQAVVGRMEEGEEAVDMFSHIPRDVRQWLLKGGSSTVSAWGSSSAKEDLRAFFRHIPQDRNMWLLAAQKQLESLEELKGAGRWFHHIPKETATWLRRAHDKRAAAPPDMFAHISKDKSLWLKTREATGGAEQIEVEEQDAQDSAASFSPPGPAPLQALPNLGKAYQAGTPSAVESWLLHQDCEAAGDEPGDDILRSLPGVQRYLDSSSSSISSILTPSAWLINLAGGEQNTEPKSSSSIPPQFFSHISSKPSDWLHSSDPQKSRNNNSIPPSQPIDLQKAAPPTAGSGSFNQWLKPGSSALTEKSAADFSSPMDDLLRSFSHLGTSDWLLGHQREAGSEGSSESTRSWHVLSESPQSSVASLPSVVTSGRQYPPLNAASWVFQKNAL